MISAPSFPRDACAKFAHAYGGPGICTVVASDVLLGPIERPSQTESSPIPMKRTDDYTGGGAHPAARSFQPRWRSGKKPASAGSISRGPWRSDTTSGCARFRPLAQGRFSKTRTFWWEPSARRPPPAARSASTPSKCAGCSITPRSSRAQALHPGGADTGPYREGICVWRQQRTQRSERRLMVDLAGQPLRTFCQAPIISWSRTIRRVTRPK